MDGNPVRSVRFTLPLPPGINQQYASVGDKRVLSKESRDFKKSAAHILRRLCFEGKIPDGFLQSLKKGYVGLFLDFYFETPLRRDLDGGLKIAQDVICDTLGINDNRVVDVHLVKRVDPRRPRLEVEMEAISDWQFDLSEYVVL